MSIAPPPAATATKIKVQTYLLNHFINIPYSERVIYLGAGHPRTKWDRFIYFPMNDKPVDVLPGIGCVSSDKLRRRRNITKAFEVYEKFWALERRLDLFTNWLQEACDARDDRAVHCYKALNSYSENFLKSVCGISDSNACLMNNMIFITIVIQVRL